MAKLSVSCFAEKAWDLHFISRLWQQTLIAFMVFNSIYKMRGMVKIMTQIKFGIGLAKLQKVIYLS